mgnify:CR=1 FL=1
MERAIIHVSASVVVYIYNVPRADIRYDLFFTADHQPITAITWNYNIKWTTYTDDFRNCPVNVVLCVCLWQNSVTITDVYIRQVTSRITSINSIILFNGNKISLFYERLQWQNSFFVLENVVLGVEGWCSG